MPLFGAHMSVAGGMCNAVEDSIRHGCGTVQVFTKNASQWKGKPLVKDDILAFRKAIQSAGLKKNLSHNSYLINLGSQDDAMFAKSVDAMVDEMERAEALELDYLVAHPGSHLGAGEEAGLKRIACGLDETQARCKGFKVKLLLEITAGQGTNLGWRFEHIASILHQVKAPELLGVCFDTCHAFAAGYAMGTKSEYESTFQQFDEIIGLKKLLAFHVNDSKKKLGSRVDRHEHIGKGEMGLEPFRFLVNDKRFTKIPMVLETAKEEGDNENMDAINLGTLKKLVQK